MAAPDPGGNPTQPGGLTFKVARKQTGVVLRGSVTTSGAAKIVVTALVSNRCLSTSRPKRNQEGDRWFEDRSPDERRQDRRSG